MSAAIVEADGKTVLPRDVCEAAGLRALDQVEWSYYQGEIRGRRLTAVPVPKVLHPVVFKDLLILPTDLDVDLNALDNELALDRLDQDGRLLG